MQMILELADAVEMLKKDSEVRVVVLTGIGKAFSSGGDLRFLLENCERPSTEIYNTIVTKVNEIMYALHTMDKITIAAIKGVAIGAGLALALACDLRIAAEGAKLSTGFARIGLHAEFGISYFLTKLTNPSQALELMLTSEFVDAREAERLGLVNKVVPPKRVESEALELATRIARGPWLAIRLIKKDVYESVKADLKTILEREALGQALCLRTEDAKEGIKALIERREPQFKGR
jgi:2-(1,2-epoxy-1,2-dihydrophenyl)acetyl-CoA isomerase